VKEALGTRVAHYLEDHHVAVLSTAGSEGPWGAAVFYVSDGYILYFLSSPTSRHALELAANPRVAVTIQENQTDWLKIKGVQIQGVAGKLFGAEEERARRLYAEKFPLVGLLAKAPAAIVQAMAKVSWYKVIPHNLYFIDNSQGLGHRDELDLTATGKDGKQDGA
jgi:uncharacterized protein YhbP (UPF0306 family)